MKYGQRVMIVATPDADMKQNKDYIIGGLGIAYRRRRFTSGAKTERQKILDGECRAKLFIWEFEDAWVVCTLGDVTAALKSNAGYAKLNNDGITSAYYIAISKIQHLTVTK